MGRIAVMARVAVGWGAARETVAIGCRSGNPLPTAPITVAATGAGGRRSAWAGRPNRGLALKE